MKKLLLISSILLASVSSNAQGIWISQSSGFQAVQTVAINFSVLDTSNVWISGGELSGFPHHDYSRTIDGGAHWIAGDNIPSELDWAWAMLTASSPASAWALLYNSQITPPGLGQIWHTVDSGNTWTQQGVQIYNTVDESFPNIIHFWNDTDGVVIGDPIKGEFEIYTTTDGGTNWNEVSPDNIADPIVTPTVDETGYTTHIYVIGDTIWFDTNAGRVYRSVDHGYNWTAAATNLVLPSTAQPSIDIAFMNSNNGIARYFNATNNVSDVVETTDGGITWSSTFTPVGNFFENTVKHVPGTSSMLVSTGIRTDFRGSSYSLDGGHNWTDIEVGTQRQSLGIADSLTMWSSGPTISPTMNGVYKFVYIPQVACSDGSVTPGTGSASTLSVCGGDTVEFTCTGIFAPNSGDYSGFTWVLSSGDISGSSNPLAEPSYLKSEFVVFPTPTTDTRIFINDGSYIDGSNNPYGDYYWTPVVYGNATVLNSPVQFLQDLTLDQNCTFTGTSIAVSVLDPLAFPCIDAISEIRSNQLSVRSIVKDLNTLDVLINSSTYGKVSVEITDVTGRLVKTQNSNVTKGNNHEIVNIEKLASGTYILKVQVNGNLATSKVVKY